MPPFDARSFRVKHLADKISDYSPIQNVLVLINEKESLYCAALAESLYIIQGNFNLLKGLTMAQAVSRLAWRFRSLLSTLGMSV
jgi:hypothetical protein